MNLKEKRKLKHDLPTKWIVTIDGVIIPYSEYDWTEDGNFYFPKTLLELAQEYCSIHKKYKSGDKVSVVLKCEWEVELNENT